MNLNLKKKQGFRFRIHRTEGFMNSPGHESLAAMAQHARTRPRWPPRPSLRIFFRLSHTGGADRCYRGLQPDAVRKRALQAGPAAFAFGARVSLFSLNTHHARLPLSSHPCLRPFAPPTHCRSTRCCEQSVQTLFGCSRGCTEMISV